MLVGPLSRQRPQSSARAQAYDRLREAIVSLRLEPRTRLSDIALAAEMGVSRTPVREAVLQLADEGLVDVIPQNGTYVAPISLEAVREAQFIREALELAALRETVDRVREWDLADLATNLEAQRMAEAADDVTRFYELDQAFHRRLMELSGFPGAWRIAERSRAHLNRVRILSLPGGETIAELVGQHAEIIGHLGDGDGDRAASVMRAHLWMIFRQLPTLERAYPHFFAASYAIERRSDPGGTPTGELDAAH